MLYIYTLDLYGLQIFCSFLLLRNSRRFIVPHIEASSKQRGWLSKEYCVALAVAGFQPED